ncbi:MAG: glycosyltransferase [Candidatus Hydrogenedentota bacterium]
MTSTSSELPGGMPPFALTKTDRVREFYDDSVDNLEEFRRKNAYYYGQLSSLARDLIAPGKRILDIGCGLGFLLNDLAPSRGVGIDLSPAIVDAARLRFPHLEFHAMDIQTARVEGEFDVVLFANSIGDIEDIWRAFRNIRKNCTQDTRIIILNYNYLWAPILKLGETIGKRMPQPNLNWLNFDDITNLLYLNGYESIRMGFTTILPVEIPLLSNFINRYIGPFPLVHRLGLINYTVARPMPGGLRPEREYTVSVICPVRNEAGNIEDAVTRLPRMGKHTELIFVDGNSDDGTREKILEMIDKYAGRHEIRLVDQGSGKGKGDAMRKGYAAANGEVFMILDGDLTVPPEDLPKFYHAIEEGRGEFINGSRLVYPMEGKAMRPLNVIANHFFALVFSFLLGQRLKDTLCGTKVLRRSDYDKIAANRHYFGEFDPFGDFDLIFGAARQNLRIIEMPIRYRDRTYGDTKISRFRHGFLLLKMCLVALQRVKFRIPAPGAQDRNHHER